MGLYDEVRVNGQTVQTKAFSRLLCRYEAGDKLDVHTWDDAPRVIDRHDSPTAAVAALDETGNSCWIILRGGVIDSITDRPPEGIARFDYRGRPDT